MIEESIGSAAFWEHKLVGHAEQLRITKPDDKKQHSLHGNATTFFTELANSLGQHNQETIFQLRGDARKARGCLKAGMKHERAAVKAMRKLFGDLYSAQDGTAPTYVQLGIDREMMARFEDRFISFALIEGKISMWDDFDLEPS